MTKRIFKDIAPKLLSLMESQTGAALQNPEGNNLFAACLSAVEHMFESVRDDCIDIGREFIESRPSETDSVCMKQNSVASIVAALKTFKCVVKSISPNKAADIVSNAFSKLGAFLLHSEGVVRSAVTELLATICEFNHEVIMAERVIKEDFHVFYEIMKGDDHELTAGLCDMFATLIVTATHEKYCITWRNLAADMTPLALCLMTRVTSNLAGDCKVMDKSSGMLINLIVKAYSGPMILKLVHDMLGMYQDVANFPKDRVETLANGVFVCLGMCIHTAKRRRDPLDSELLIRIYKDSNKLIRATGILPREYIFLARRVATGSRLK